MKKHAAFTLIELLTAMAILSIIVMIALRIFVQSSTVWNVSSTRARINMLGRSAVDYVSQKNAVTYNGVGIMNELTNVVFGSSVLPAWTTTATEEVGARPVSVAVELKLTVNDPLRASGTVQAWSGGPDGDPSTVNDNINSWN